VNINHFLILKNWLRMVSLQKSSVQLSKTLRIC